jgi:hypothetical protein
VIEQTHVDVATLVLGLVSAIGLPTLGFFIRRWINKTDEDVGRVRDENAESNAELRRTVESWVQETSRDVNALGEKLNKHQISVAEQYVSEHRLGVRLDPIMIGIKELKDGQDRIFDRLDQKQDKAKAR